MPRTAPHSTARTSLVSALVLAACTLAPSIQAAVPAGGTPSTAAATARAATITPEYNLGDTAFTDPQTGTVSEIRAVVHYPAQLSGQLPLVQAHGSWQACTDPTAQAWPCDKGTPEPSYRGYDYLGQQLAQRGFITVSLSADGINMNSFDYGDRARLINEHLRLWQQLAARKGPLARRLPSLADHVDMHRIGTMGHSRGGKGVMWEASDKHSSEVPAGVRIAAVLAVAPVKFDDPEGDHSDTLVTHVPVGVVTGTCDGAVHEAGQEYLDDAEGKTHKPAYSVSLQNANHNYYNTDWTPPSPSGDDDSTCPGQELTPHTQQDALTAYATAFYKRFLNDDKQSKNILTGKAAARRHRQVPVRTTGQQRLNSKMRPIGRAHQGIRARVGGHANGPGAEASLLGRCPACDACHSGGGGQVADRGPGSQGLHLASAVRAPDGLFPAEGQAVQPSCDLASVGVGDLEHKKDRLCGDTADGP